MVSLYSRRSFREVSAFSSCASGTCKPSALGADGGQLLSGGSLGVGGKTYVRGRARGRGGGWIGAAGRNGPAVAVEYVTGRV